MFIFCKERLMTAAAGALAATLGVRIIWSRDARKLYTAGTAAVLREKDRILAGATNFKADCEDILADAREINEKYAEMDRQTIEDRSGAASGVSSFTEVDPGSAKE